uniref:Ig-like domain-containing protein n=1 Tax=Cyprinus carpio TaxID=7962 RepID=A0A8C2DW04_CYPCA
QQWMALLMCKIDFFFRVESLSLTQTQKVLLKQKGKSVSFTCEVEGLGSSNFVHWYHKKDGETFKRILYISESGSATTEATVGNVIKRFGSGTRLIVTGEPVKLPKVSGYLPSKKYIDKQGKQTMLCQASDMFPDLVKFTWRTKSEAGDFKDVPEENVVEQSYKRDNKTVTVTSMMIIDKNTIEKNNYQCTVTHEGTTKNTEILEMKRGNLKKL